MDLTIPVLDGYGAVRILREVPKLSEVPIVACTGDVPAHRAQAMRVGFSEFLAKPIDFDELNFVIDRFLKAA